MTPVPGSDTRILGLSNLHGEVIAVIDLAAMIGIDTNTERERVVVAEQGSRRCGFAVDHVVDVGSLAERTPEHQLPYITATALVEDSLVGVLDARALLEALREVGGQ
jgi:chemotaxis signal transduction protein